MFLTDTAIAGVGLKLALLLNLINDTGLSRVSQENILSDTMLLHQSKYASGQKWTSPVNVGYGLGAKTQKGMETFTRTGKLT